MPIRWRLAIESTLLVLCAATGAMAGEPVAPVDTTRPDERSAATRASTNPLPYVTKLEVEPSYTWSSDSTLYRAELLFEALVPYAGALLPGLVIEDVWSVSRLQIIGESLQNSNGTFSGLENLNFVDVAASRWGTLSLGAGVGTVFPIATSSELGPAKWQLGPAVAFHWAPAPAFSLAMLGQALWSVAGSDQVADQSYVNVQPFVTLHINEGILIKSDATMNIYWSGGSTKVPMNLGIGYAFSKHFVGAVKGEIVVADSDDVGTTKGVLELTFLP